MQGNRTACEEVEDNEISYSTYGFLETCIAAHRSGLCVHKQVADACPVHCGRCGGRPAAWGALFDSFVLPLSLTEKVPLSVLRSNMCRPELDLFRRLREQGLWSSFLYLPSRESRRSMWCTSWQTVLPCHVWLVWCVPALLGRVLTAAAIFVVAVQKSLIMSVLSLSHNSSVYPTASRARRLAFVDVTLTQLRIAREQYCSFH